MQMSKDPILEVPEHASQAQDLHFYWLILKLKLEADDIVTRMRMISPQLSKLGQERGFDR